MEEEPEESGPEIPEWVVTFGDMMSLLLTFFIMLVSLSEIKEDEKYQALVDSMHRQFGYSKSLDSLAPGDAKPRASAMSVLATTGRAKRKDTAKGGVPEPAPHGEEPMVRIIRPGKRTAVGAVVFFEVGDADLDAEGKRVLDQVSVQLRGKPQKIEIRGHASPELAARTGDVNEAMDLGYLRARHVLDYLVNVTELDAKRFRLNSAGATEPMHSGGDSANGHANARVEVFLLDENAEDLRGTSAERAQRVLQTPTNDEAP
ncbi:Motility protein B [Roseimaritima multifibrata]|uniref:Motility protein B n=1 Tax=Roseimaritima multifibrata TaxID=1930274 RepID=A0A517MLT8_9BACT|nr:flagellar motor protein MotB [Roseimaritima multifibrata]QDS95856.1 Motility protein B [Roseimaritima multifibrata]